MGVEGGLDALGVFTKFQIINFTVMKLSSPNRAPQRAVDEVELLRNPTTIPAIPNSHH